MTAERRADRWCIIGAGFSGLAVAAAFKRHGIAYDQLEADVEVGGNWLHGVYHDVRIITSRKTTAYTDHPMPADWSEFPSAGQVLEYLKGYADAKGLRANLEFSARVSHVRPLADGEWEVSIEGRPARVYGGVVVCNGHHWDMRVPTYPGRFTGRTLHSKQYKLPEELAGQRVLVVGLGNSGCDIAVDAARVGREAHISARAGSWIMPKTLLGVPTVEYLKPWMTPRFQRWFVETALRWTVGPYERYGLDRPTDRVFDRHPTINSMLLYELKQGTIKPHRDIARLEGKKVHFVDGTSIEVDTIVWATGFHVSVPMLAEGIIHWKDGFPDLVDGVFAARHRNLAVAGIGQPRYGAGPVLYELAETLAAIVKVQPELEFPVGVLLAELGEKPLETYFFDPFVTMRKLRVAARLAPLLPKLEKLLAKRLRRRMGPREGHPTGSDVPRPTPPESRWQAASSPR